MVAAPPRFAQKTSDRIIGTGPKHRICASSSVTVARKQHDRDAVDEHGQKRGHGHEAHQQRHDMIVRGFGQRQAQPTEEAGFAEALDHDHHTGDEEDGRPADGSQALRRRQNRSRRGRWRRGSGRFWIASQLCMQMPNTTPQRSRAAIAKRDILARPNLSMMMRQKYDAQKHRHEERERPHEHAAHLFAHLREAHLPNGISYCVTAKETSLILFE